MEEFARSNFAASVYVDETGKRNPIQYMTRDGYCLVAMGFNNSPEALHWKMKFLAAFNKYESAALEAHARAPAVHQRRLLNSSRYRRPARNATQTPPSCTLF
jgi:phage regulator Rha-like protein